MQSIRYNNIKRNNYVIKRGDYVVEKQKTVKTSLYLEAETLKALKIKAIQSELTMSEYVVKLLKDEIKNETLKELK